MGDLVDLAAYRARKANVFHYGASADHLEWHTMPLPEELAEYAEFLGGGPIDRPCDTESHDDEAS